MGGGFIKRYTIQASKCDQGEEESGQVERTQPRPLDVMEGPGEVVWGHQESKLGGGGGNGDLGHSTHPPHVLFPLRLPPHLATNLLQKAPTRSRAWLHPHPE